MAIGPGENVRKTRGPPGLGLSVWALGLPGRKSSVQPFSPLRTRGVSGRSPACSPQLCHPLSPRVRAAARPAVDGDVACCPAGTDSALLPGQFGERVRGVKHWVCVFEKGSDSQGRRCLKKEKDPEAFLFLYRYRTAGRKRL